MEKSESKLSVIPLEKRRLEAIVEFTVAAFLEDPIFKRISEDVEVRKAALFPFWRAVIGYAMRYGRVYTTSEENGVACWMAPGDGQFNFWRMVATRFALPFSISKFPSKIRKRFVKLLTWTEKEHKRLLPQPHWYLWLLGVAPEAQGRGVGTLLLNHILPLADEAKELCYLETESEENVAYYQKRGFEVVCEKDFGDIEMGTLWLMIRKPK